MKKIGLSLLGILVLTLILIQTYTKEKQTEPLSSLRINLQEGDPPSLHPHVGIALCSRALLRVLFEGLTRINENDQIELAAAEKVDISPNQDVYTFIIRPHHWSNGSKVTAYHFETAWKKALSPSEPCLMAELFYVIKNAKAAKKGTISLDQVGIKVVNEQTLVVELEHSAPYFLDLLTNPVFSPLFDDEKEPKVFNGPFKLESWNHESNLKFVKNPYYWDVKSVKLQEIIFYMVKDSSAALSLFESGEIDYMGNPFSSFTLDALTSKSLDSRLQRKPVARTYWVYLNTEKFPLNSAKIRKALSYVLNRNDLALNLLAGQTPHKSPIPKTLSLLNEKETYQDNDPVKAKQLFEEGLIELGLTKETFPQLILSYSSIPGQKSLAETLQQIWQKTFDISLKLEGSEWNVFSSNLNKRQFQLGGCIRSAYFNDPLYHLELFKDKANVQNASAWENEDYKRCIDLANNTSDQTQRKILLKQAEEMLLEEMPVIPIFVDTYKYLTHDKLKGFIIDKSGTVDLKKAYFKRT